LLQGGSRPIKEFVGPSPSPPTNPRQGLRDVEKEIQALTACLGRIKYESAQHRQKREQERIMRLAGMSPPPRSPGLRASPVSSGRKEDKEELTIVRSPSGGERNRDSSDDDRVGSRNATGGADDQADRQSKGTAKGTIGSKGVLLDLRKKSPVRKTRIRSPRLLSREE